MARFRCCVWQMLLLLVLILVSPCQCDGMLIKLPDGAEPDPVNPTLEKSTTRTVPYQQVNPLFEPPLPTQVAAPSTRKGEGDSPPVRSHISHAGTDQEKQQGTINPSQDSQAYLSAEIFDSVENNADTSAPSRRQGLPSKSVGNDEDRNGQVSEEYPVRSQFPNNLKIGNAPSSTQKAHTDTRYPSVDRLSESSVLEEAEKKQVGEVQAEDRVNDDSYRDHNTQISQTGQKDIGIVGHLANRFSEKDVKKEPQQTKSNWVEAQNTEYKDSAKSEKSPSYDDAGVLGVLAEYVSRNHSGVETDEHMAKIQTLSSLVSRGYTEHTTSSSSKSNVNFKIPKPLPASFEGAKLNVPHSVGNLAESPSSAMQTEKTSPEMNSGIASQEKEQAFTADQGADKSPLAGNAAEGTPQPSSSTSPDVDRVFATEEQTTNTDDQEVDGDDWWYFDPDYKEEDEAEDPSPLLQSSPGPQRAVAKSENVNDVKDSTFFSEVHEKVVKEEDVAQKKKKKTNTPKDSIIIYTVTIVILVTGIVVFFLWKNTSKKGRGRNLLSVIPTGDEGKRLLDHPFV